MSTIVTRAGKGSALTWTEADDNFTNLNADKVEAADVTSAIAAAVGVSVQAYSANLDEYAAVNPTAAGLALLDDASAADQRTTLGLVIGTNVQAYDADLTTWAGVTPGTGVATALAVNVGSAGAVVTNGGALGTPSSGDLSNCTGYPTSGAITLATPVASTSGTSIDFTGIPAGTKRITVNFVGVSTNGTSPLLIQIGDSGGIETSGYVSTVGDYGTAVASTAGFIIITLAAAASTFYGSVTLNLENSSLFTWCGSGNISDTTTAYYSSGAKSLSAELDRVRITTSGGVNTFDAGQINISYG